MSYKQDGTIVCIFRRKVMVPKDSYLEARGGEQPGRPVPAAGQELAGGQPRTDGVRETSRPPAPRTPAPAAGSPAPAPSAREPDTQRAGSHEAGHHRTDQRAP